MEVIPVLDLRAVGVAELFVQVLLLGEPLVGADVEREMMCRAGAEAPAARRAVRLVVEHQRFRRAAGMHFESMIRAVSARLAKSQRVDEEPFLLGCVLN